MENQHRKIKGYGELSEQDILLINKIKAHGEKTKELLDELYQHNIGMEEDSALSADQMNESYRALRLAKDDLQTGQMWLIRSVALPNSF